MIRHLFLLPPSGVFSICIATLAAPLIAGCRTTPEPSHNTGDHPRETDTQNIPDSDSASTRDSSEDADSNVDATVSPDGGGACLTPVSTDSGTPTDTQHTDGETETVDGTDTHIDSASGTDTSTASDTRHVSDTETGDTDSIPSVDSETVDSDPNTDTLVDSEIDTATQTDTFFGETDTDRPCPDDMVHISAGDTITGDHPFCIDKYEASRSDATATEEGADDTIAMSRSGVLPWYVNPITVDAFTLFQEACVNAGKRICAPNEWVDACKGPDDNRYVFGDSFSPAACNCVDTFCEAYCESNDIPADECNVSTNCGYACGVGSTSTACFQVLPTGSMAACTNALGTFDINGNVWEVIPSSVDPRGFEVRGGAFNCASPSSRLQCAYNADWEALYAGFRCCKDPH